MSKSQMREFVEAARALVEVQQMLFARFEASVGVSAYDYWIAQTTSRKLGDDIVIGECRFSFHGLEVDVENVTDHRFVRMELGPRGMTNVFSGWSIGVFVVAAKPPWPVFPKLRECLTYAPRFPRNRPCCELADLARQAGHFTCADLDLFNLRKRHTRRMPDGQIVIDLPDNSWPTSSTDVFLCDRLVLSREASAN